MTDLRIVLCVALLSGLWACGGTRLPQDRVSRVRSTLTAARRDGAYRCAPRELAMAEAHLQFALAEAEQGDLDRAERHLGEAELNARAARTLSPSGRCGDGERSPTLPDAQRGEDRDHDGVPDRADLCPDVAEDLDSHLDRDGCPDRDNDEDGIEDAADSCPDDAEDFDGFADEDGCPERDNDGDGVLDADDACPTLPGGGSEDGCPERNYPGLTLDARGVHLQDGLAFDRRGQPNASSLSVLDTVAQVLADFPMLRLEIGAHTDSRGDDTANLKLSQRRAEAVRDALVERGVDPSRLTAVGYGETRPIESNRTSQGRAINRRIEFLRSDRAPEEAGKMGAGASDGSE